MKAGDVPFFGRGGQLRWACLIPGRAPEGADPHWALFPGRSGISRCRAASQVLLPVSGGDLRARTGKQPFVKDAPLELIYVADLSRATRGSADDKASYTAADAGFIAQNVYLFCASAGLATVVRGSVDRQPLSEALKFRADQKIILAQTVGLPGK